jgi:tetratricopeptide (TPR) repeat protein
MDINNQMVKIEVSHFLLYVNLGDFNFLSGKFEEALKWYLKARECDPRRREPYLSINLARTYWGLGMSQ